MNLLIVTACPNGMVTSVLTSRLLEAAAQRLGWSTAVEVHDPKAIGSPLTPAQIANADLVVVVKTGPLSLQRFVGKRVAQSTPSEALLDPEAFLRSAAEAATELQAADDAEPTPATGKPKLVAITACPTGVAHTFMAAEALQQAAIRKGYDLQVETRGSVGARNVLEPQAIEDADVVLLAADIEVDVARFAGKRVYRCGTGVALKQPEATLDRALKEGAVLSGGTAASDAGGEQKGEKTGVYKHLLTGVSYMLPMVVAGGLLIALSFVFGIEAFKEEGTLAAALMKIGGETAFQLMVPLLAGYIAYSIADRPGLAPGMIGGLLAGTLGAGFIGGIIAGFVAGYAAKAVSRWIPLPASIESLKPILIIPLLASLVTGLVMIYIVGTPVAKLLAGLTDFLDTMGTSNAILLGLLLGTMMCVDLGGPVNKAAYAFSVGLLASQSYAPMAATMAAGMVPPIGMGIATLIARRKFAQTEREAGKAALVLGCCFISEGAIPFAAKDPLRVIPASIAGGALTGALSMAFGAKLLAPHGGLFVLLIPNAINHALLYLVAILAGSLVTGLIYAVIKRPEAQPLAVSAAS
ncbi:PTS fructose-like transporter subunit IIB [Stutzerimonas xanthomarina]|jgi:PTS system fructose-specific IIC component|uniref:PTS fructose-like transporter subunit IIB n=1 Tax=Stutzerimonas xanthomarina TaxID=271420 RepID=UPI00190BD431|nr:PTS fructose-like transporter subunit IIB [Stutzerimonas xanthomarina]MBU0853811.1 PTS fructose-like transporter subunit IIB [Gammaproteobacteria bacterium]MBK3845227.1 PTS fructose-like transporter subunit IIB [Stutzerimonas xanthomarina]MBK3846336.1 PTS fructose-like transporter subunit IIB [Stutzerimonas xanthomarina]MBU1461399.1 PTS fructose-like transporter subunit IIB [Gammaproteobacteria bacterium]MBU1774545.1 PTS fructose-like transporter subunit IIB [Gammaproteobacteria bacterium]|tara:strand:+ start:880 stop:2619 length:1740 start_codon:yes stop_codon:yes gene_type:complete